VHRPHAAAVLACLIALTVVAAATADGGDLSRSSASVVDLDLRTLDVVDRSLVESSRASIGAAAARTVQRADGPGPRDPLLDSQIGTPKKSATAWISGIDVDGIGYSGTTPADAAGDVGESVYVQVVNGERGSLFAVYDVTDGSLLAGPSRIESLAAGGACADGWGHPGVAYDRGAQRWVLFEVGAGNHLCVYVSRTADPVAGGWHAYDFELPRFPDFPRLGVWSDAYIVTTNEDFPAIYAFERNAMLAGSPAAWVRMTVDPLEGFGFQALTPIDLDGASAPGSGGGGLVLRQVDGGLHGGADRIEVFEVDVDWASSAAASLIGPTSITVASFDSSLCGAAEPRCVPQPGTAVTLDPGRAIVSSVARFRRVDGHEAVVGAFAVDADGADRAGVRWFELRRDTAGWSLYQEGTYSPDGVHRWAAAPALDGAGNLALVFNASDASSTSPSVMASGRDVASPPGVLTVTEQTLRAGTGAQTAGHSPERWGSSSVAVSPADDCTFWATSALADAGGWSTLISSFRFPGCGDTPSGLIFSDGFESGDLQSWGQ
jgi:hypothetical protein